MIVDFKDSVYIEYVPDTKKKELTAKFTSAKTGIVLKEEIFKAPVMEAEVKAMIAYYKSKFKHWEYINKEKNK